MISEACAALWRPALLAQGVHPKIVQERLGHATVSGRGWRAVSFWDRLRRTLLNRLVQYQYPGQKREIRRSRAS